MPLDQEEGLSRPASAPPLGSATASHMWVGYSTELCPGSPIPMLTGTQVQEDAVQLLVWTCSQMLLGQARVGSTTTHTRTLSRGRNATVPAGCVLHLATTLNCFPRLSSALLPLLPLPCPLAHKSRQDQPQPSARLLPPPPPRVPSLCLLLSWGKQPKASYKTDL